jgi:hypothetical protein
MSDETPSGRKIKADPGTARLLDNLFEKQAKRSKKKHREMSDEEKQAAEQRRQAMRNRVTYDIPKEIVDQVKGMAEAVDCPESQLVSLLLWKGLQLVYQGEFDLEEYKHHSNSPKKKFNLKIPQKSGRKAK